MHDEHCPTHPHRTNQLGQRGAALLGTLWNTRWALIVERSQDTEHAASRHLAEQGLQTEGMEGLLIDPDQLH